MKITEKELHNLISECVQEYIQENQLNGGFKAKATNYRNANNKMVAESTEKKLEKIIKESIKKNLK
jgi:hypothetical protein